ncbi:Phospholipase D delta [Bienertia sinuspersici]
MYLFSLQNLVCANNLVIDTSIQTSYIKAIRSAQHFIYIEKQYFLISSYAWPNNKHAGADHLILMELALKIASKIRARKRFTVYVVIPIWPEGVFTSSSMQKILFRQDVHPQEYLNFYCHGNREPPLDLTDSSHDFSFTKVLKIIYYDICPCQRSDS